MTREEAVDILEHNWTRLENHDYTEEELNEALDIAIKALEQEPCEDEYIKVPQKALKYRTAGMVAYNTEWLKKHFDIERAVICGVQEPKTGHCKDCKWWKDKDGVYRRGIGAESKCPINRREVMEGMGYCFMFEHRKVR